MRSPSRLPLMPVLALVSATSGLGRRFRFGVDSEIALPGCATQKTRAQSLKPHSFEQHMFNTNELSRLGKGINKEIIYDHT